MTPVSTSTTTMTFWATWNLVDDTYQLDQLWIHGHQEESGQ